VADALRQIAARTGRPLTTLNPHVRAMLTRKAVADDLRVPLAGGHRKGLRRQLRRLEETGRVNFAVASDSETAAARLEEFFALELGGWKGKRGTALASSGATAAFAREAVLNLAASGNVRIHSLRLDDRPIAALISFIAGATAYTWKIAYDEAYARFSPGVQLMLEAPAQLFADPAVMRIDSCAEPDHTMIDRLWPDRLAMATFVLGPPGGGAVHAVGLAAARAELAARANARLLLNRR
jgi:CelD/BcsL family acetyltransferase involved in cellulose biosynthesis